MPRPFPLVLLVISLLLLFAHSRPSPADLKLDRSLSQAIFLNSLVPNSHFAESAEVSFLPCEASDYRIYGSVSSLNIYPCRRSSPNKPCVFAAGSNYTIEIGFTSELDAERPRSSVVAQDEQLGPYQYSGQNFSACHYGPCPIRAHVPSVYTYHFITLNSWFDYLDFNVTTSVTGSSIFCVGTPIEFQPKKRTGSHE